MTKLNKQITYKEKIIFLSIVICLLCFYKTCSCCWTTYYYIPPRAVIEERFAEVGIVDLLRKTELLDMIADNYRATNEVVASVVDALSFYEKKLKSPNTAKEKYALTLDDLRRIDIKCVAALILRDHPAALEELDKIVNAGVQRHAPS